MKKWLGYENIPKSFQKWGSVQCEHGEQFTAEWIDQIVSAGFKKWSKKQFSPYFLFSQIVILGKTYSRVSACAIAN